MPVNTFNRLSDKHLRKSGVEYSVEKIDVLGIKGDLAKKYVNGKLRDQKFVTKDKLQKLVRRYSMKGGKKNDKKNAKKTRVNVQKNTIFQRMLLEQQIREKIRQEDLLNRNVKANEQLANAVDTGNKIQAVGVGIAAIEVLHNVFEDS
jgi:hypothetical protein